MRFRTQDHKLHVDIEKRNCISLHETVCPVCLAAIGDEYHYILICDHFRHERTNYVKQYYNRNHNVIKSTQLMNIEVSKGAKIRNRYNQVPHLTQGTNGKVTNSQLDTTNESQEVSPFPAGDHKAHINIRTQIHNKHKTEQKHKRSTKEVPPWNDQ